MLTSKQKQRIMYRLFQLRLSLVFLHLEADRRLSLHAISYLKINFDLARFIKLYFTLQGCNLKDCLLKQLEFQIFEYNHRPLYFSSQKLTKANFDGLSEGVASLKMIQFYKNPQRQDKRHRLLKKFQMEFGESIQQLKNSTIKVMDYLIKQEDILDLKMEENSGQYLFNSLLDISNIQPQSYLEDDAHAYSFFERENPGHIKTQSQSLQESIIYHLSHIYNLRTTPLSELIQYAEKAYALTEVNKKALWVALKRYKLQLKRQNAKKPPVPVESYEEVQQEVKLQENGLQEFCYEGESQETKKKKRNRMSAQKSRDRKKQYIKEIQKINKQYKRKIEEITSKKRKNIKSTSRQFVKVLLCLGITCFLNVGPHNAQNLTDQERPSTESISTFEATEQSPNLQGKFDIGVYKRLLPMSQQAMLDQALEAMSGVDEAIQIKSSSQQGVDEYDEIPPDRENLIERNRKQASLNKRASSCSFD